MTELTEKYPGQIKIWFQAVRPFSFTASLVPVFLAAAMASNCDGPVTWHLFPLVIICSLLFNAGTNTVNDYCDFLNGLDKDYIHGSSGLLVNNVLEPKQLLTAGIIMFLIACLLGVVLIVVRGLPILILGLVGLAGGIFYTAKPIAYKYIALGDILVFILLGPLMVVGSFFVLTGTCNNNVVLASLPVGFLVAAILFANNLRDIRHDTGAGIKTLAIVLGHNKARYIYCAILTAAYALVIVMLAMGFTTWLLLVFISVPLALNNIKMAHSSSPESNETIATLDVRTAKLHLLFGLLYTAAIAIGKIP